MLTSGCTGINPTLDTVTAIWNQPRPIQFVRGLEYLEVSVGRHQTVMALGARTMQDGHTLEQWFSGQGEMLELRDGRIHRVLGMTSEIRQTRGIPASWRQAGQARAAVVWQREREAMPGYQLRTEHVTTRTTPAPRSGALVDAIWVREEVHSRQLNGQAWHYTERFALRGEQVVYSEQCISPDLCLKLKPLGMVNP